MLTGRRPPHDYLGTVLNAQDPRTLGRFYAEVLDWRIHNEDEDWVTIAPEKAHVYLAFQSDPEHIPPVWPNVEGQQQMQMHLDIEVSDLEVAVESAVRLGGSVADYQPQQDVRVIVDPAGNPFCLYVAADEPEE